MSQKGGNGTGGNYLHNSAPLVREDGGGECRGNVSRINEFRSHLIIFPQSQQTFIGYLHLSHLSFLALPYLTLPYLTLPNLHLYICYNASLQEQRVCFFF